MFFSFSTITAVHKLCDLDFCIVMILNTSEKRLQIMYYMAIGSFDSKHVYGVNLTKPSLTWPNLIWPNLTCRKWTPKFVIWILFWTVLHNFLLLYQMQKFVDIHKTSVARHHFHYSFIEEFADYSSTSRKRMKYFSKIR